MTPQPPAAATAARPRLTEQPKPAVPAPKRQLDLYSALRSALRMWLVARDSVIWLLVAGADGADSAVISELTPADLLRDMTPSLDQMNELRRMAYGLAAQISATGAEAVVRDELSRLLSEESPKFLLAVDGIPGAF
jgi:hypothetical protein